MSAHLLRTIPIFLSLAILFLASGCSVTTTSVPPTPHQPGHSGQMGAVQQAGVEFSTDADRLAHQSDQYDKEVRCRKGNGSKGAPIICVDNATAKPEPYLVQVWDFEGEGGYSTNRPVIVHWFTRRTAKLQVVPGKGADGRDCVAEPVCNGGHCYAIVQPLRDREERTCKYDVFVDGRKENSKTPGMSVVPCCW